MKNKKSKKKIVLQFVSNRRRNGFTIIEMIVATFLLAVGVAAALGCISVSTRTTKMADDYTNAALLAQQKIAEIETQLSSLTGGTQNGDFGNEASGFSWEENVETTDFTNLYKVTVTISWGRGNEQYSIQVPTYEIATQSTN